MKNVILFFVFFSCSLVQGQNKEKVSGFLGKRIAIGVGADVSLSFQPQKQGMANASPEKPTFNRIFYAQLEYAVSNYACIGFRGGTSTTSLYLDDYGYSGGVNWKTKFMEYEFAYAKSTPKLTDRFFAVYGKWFFKSRGALAPVGHYFSGGLAVHNYQLDYSNVIIYGAWYRSSGERELTEFKYKNGVITTAIFPEIFISLGKSIPIGNRLCLDYGLKSGLLLVKTASIEAKNSGNINLEKFVMYETKQRLRGMYFLNYSIKLSGLF
ncbi:MAG TPA: hypothetical protein DIW47_05755 [Bacteroidetes bacterium]|nr:hypothetical protein [Bacteroidota bacterium]